MHGVWDASRVAITAKVLGSRLVVEAPEWMGVGSMHLLCEWARDGAEITSMNAQILHLQNALAALRQEVDARCPSASSGRRALCGLPAPLRSFTHLVKIAVALPMTPDLFTSDKQVKFRESIASAAQVAVADVTIDKISPSNGRWRRSSATGRSLLQEEAVRVDTSVNAADEQSAQQVVGALTEESINAELRRAGLPAATILEVPRISVIAGSAGDSTTSAKLGGGATNSAYAVGLVVGVLLFFCAALAGLGYVIRKDCVSEGPSAEPRSVSAQIQMGTIGKKPTRV